MKKTLLALAALPLLALSETVQAGTIDFSYNTAGGNDLVWGSKKAEAYDVAIFINEPALVGAKVTGMTVQLPVQQGQIKDVSAWMSKKLKLENRVNAPDILSDNVDFTGQVLNVTFSQPYTITEEGVYVGYSFDVPEVDNTDSEDYRRFPVCVQYGENKNGLWLHTSRSQLKWKSMSAQLGAVSTMVVKIEGDFNPNAAMPALAASSYIGQKEKTIAMTVTNHGSVAINNIGYTCKIGDASYEGQYTFTTPIGKNFNMSGTADLPVAVPETLGTYPMEFTITKVNGVENKDKLATLKTDVSIIPFCPVNRPLVEEYTGLWCGWCPRGYVALETMNEKYGDDFVALAWHNGDDMAITSRYPNQVGGFPYAYINRKNGLDPGNIEDEWPGYRLDVPIADIDVDLVWTNAEKTVLKATAHTTFISEPSDSYRLAFAVVMDGMQNGSWSQSNYYAGNAAPLEGKYAELFTGGKSKVKGLEFNDVVAYFPSSEYFGIDGTLPATLEAGKVYDSEYEIELANVINSSKKQMSQWLQNPDHIRVVAMLFDTRKNFINCNTSGYAVPSGVETLTGTSAQVVETIYYDLNGRRVANPENGIFVKIDVLDNGTRRTSKVIR